MLVKKIVRYILLAGFNIIIFYGFYFWFKLNIRWDVFSNIFFDIPKLAIFSTINLGFITLVLYGLRLSWLLDKKLTDSFSIVVFGFGANNILPFRIGDIFKLYFARKYFQVSISKLLFISLMEKVFDLSILLGIGFFALFFGVVAVNFKVLSLLTIALCFLVFFAYLSILLIRKNPQWLKFLRLNYTINYIVQAYIDAATNQSIKKALSISGIIWIFTVVTMYFYYALALEDFSVGLIDVLALVVITSLSLGVPSAPGGIGIFEAATVFYLTKYVGVSSEKSLAVAVVLHLSLALPQIILMLLTFSLQKITKLTSA